MRIYELGIADSAARLAADDPSLADMISAKLMSSELDSDQWRGFNAVPSPHSRTKLKDISCILAHSAYPVFAESTRNAIESEMGISRDWLPIQVYDCQYFLLNLKNVIDAIDLSKATITTLPSGRVQGIPIYAFIPEAVENQWLFKVSTRPYSVLCTDQFVDAIQQHGWTGFNVQPVWDSEVDPFPWGPTVTEVTQRPEVFGPNGFVKGFEGAWPEHWKHRNQSRY